LLTEASGAHAAADVPFADLDGEQLRVRVLHEAGDLATVLLPSTAPGGMLAQVGRAELERKLVAVESRPTSGSGPDVS
jgi:hypothetical protein